MRRWFTALAVLLAAVTGFAQQYGVVDISVCNLRATPDYDAEMVSQALLGTPVHILQITDKNGWPEVQTPDTYTGWVHKDAITLLSFDEYHAWNAAPKIVVTALAGVVRAEARESAATVGDVAQISNLFPSPYSQPLASYFTEKTEASEAIFHRLPASVFALSLFSTQ